MNNLLQQQSIENSSLSIDTHELHPLTGMLDEACGRLNPAEYFPLEELLSSSGLSFGKELESLEALIGGMELSMFQDDISNLNFSACAAGCAGTCAGCCSATCADSCSNRCKSSYNS